jgi:hypothetical protein
MKTLGNLTPEQISRLKKSADTIFQQGIPSTQFARLLHSDYMMVCNDEIPSSDDFYVLSSEENRPMRNLLMLLGYKYTVCGITKLTESIIRIDDDYSYGLEGLNETIVYKNGELTHRLPGVMEKDDVVRFLEDMKKIMEMFK